MRNFGYTPNQIAEMTIEQQMLGFKDPEKANERYVRCSSLQEARQMLAELQNR